MVPVEDLVITEKFGVTLEDRGGFTWSEVRYRLPLSIPSVGAKY